MAIGVQDRREALISQSKVNGIDFVEIVNQKQTELCVYFLNKTKPTGAVTASISGGETIPTVAVLPFTGADWHITSGRLTLTLKVEAPGDFSFYTLALTSPILDPFFDRVQFSFKANCPSDLDCAAPCPPCLPLPSDAPPIDYLAKDFLSFRKALSDFSALRYPNWHERSEADFGVMFMEALSGMADDLSYTQDRIGWEAYLQTATQRRSLVRLARLVDYEPQPAICALVTLQFDVTAGPIPPGVIVSSIAPDGTPIYFESGTGLMDASSYPASPAWNRGKLIPYYLDQSQECLAIGSTEAWIVGSGLGFYAGQPLLIDTQAPYPADPPIREIIHIVSINEETDPLNIDPSTGLPYGITHITWDEDLVQNHDLTKTTYCGNLVPGTQARRYTESFAIDTPPSSAPHLRLAIARLGPNHSIKTPAYEYLDGNFVANVSCANRAVSDAAWQYLWTLNNWPLAWLAQSDTTLPPLPEISLVQQNSLPGVPWSYNQSLLDAEISDLAYTLDPVNYAVIGTSSFDNMPYLDYNGDQGWTIRFGDGVFGQSPDPGALFRVHYRVGGGAAGNVAADSITSLCVPSPSNITAVTNPLPASGGQDMEPNQTVQRLAPQAFRAVQYRAVIPQDYEAAAKTLPWVLTAGTEFRWTGSWLTVFTTADPKGAELITVDEQTQLINLLNRYRMAGYESYAPSPVTVSLDLDITVCAESDAFRGDVEQAVLLQLSTKQFPDGTSGFFYFDNFTFGTRLERSALEAAIQRAYGVAGVVSIQYQRRGYTSNWQTLPDEMSFAPYQMLRVDNDPSRPNNGSIKVFVEGGK